jgi:CRISPR-associated endonuclease Csn1
MDKESRILGLDLGTNSIGWVLLEEEGDDPKRIVAAGTRIFSQSVEGSIEDGKDEPLGAQRREARQRRRQLDRRSMRRIKTMRCLQTHELFPRGTTISGPQRQDLINRLDRELMATLQKDGHTIADLTQLPYFLRARGLDHELSAHEFGRVIYHLSQPVLFTIKEA